MDSYGIGLIKSIKSIRDHYLRGPLVVLVAALTASLSFWVFSPTRDRNSPQPTFSAASFQVATYWEEPIFARAEADGPVYPYSVIPGGVRSAKKLQSALRHDAVAAAHYRDFRTQSARVIRVPRDRRVYLSYRVGERIYWTRKKATLHAGETLLTDGIHLARTRCGNRISEVPAEPTAASEPPAEVLNSPIVPAAPETPTDSLAPGPIWFDNPTPMLFAFNSTPQPSGPGGGGPYLPPTPIATCCSGSPGPTPRVPPPTNPLPQPLPVPPTPSTAAPEPRTLVMLVIGLAGLVFLLKFRRP
jgi:hypothetical protein